MAPTPTTSSSTSTSSSSSSMAAWTSTSSSMSSLSDAAAQMKQIAERLASHAAAAEPTVDGVTTKAKLLDSCSDVDSLRQRCGALSRENEMLRIQLDILQLQRTLDEERHSRTLHQLREEAADAAKTELSRGIVETLQGEFACSICNEVRSHVN
jgi:regulator of replication initiation timing